MRVGACAVAAVGNGGQRRRRKVAGGVNRDDLGGPARSHAGERVDLRRSGTEHDLVGNCRRCPKPKAAEFTCAAVEPVPIAVALLALALAFKPIEIVLLTCVASVPMLLPLLVPRAMLWLP